MPYTTSRRGFLAMAATAPLAGALAKGETMNDTPLRACIIGDSQQGGYGHHMDQVFKMRDDVVITGLADPDEGGRKRYARLTGVENTYADYREMLEKEKPDLVAVGPRHSIHHRDYLLACADAGAHGIIEKPLMPDLAQADEALAALKAKNLKWTIAFNFRASPVMRHARKAIIEDGLIGEVLEIRARGKEDHRAGGEDLIVLGTHLFDLMRYFLGDPAWCDAVVLQNGKPATKADAHEANEALGPIIGNSIHARYQFANGVPGYFASMKNRDGNQGRFGMDIYGTLGVVTMRMAIIPEIFVSRNGAWAKKGGAYDWTPVPGAPEVNPAARHPQAGQYAPIIDDLVTAVRNDGDLFVDIEAGRGALAMVQAVFEAAVTGSRVTFPLKNRKHPLT